MRIAKRVSLGLVALLLCGGVATGFAFWHNGYRAYVVHTGSMMPTYNPGDLVIDRPVTHLVAGQVITFRHSALTDDVVTHRIKWVKHGVLRTKGDANRTPDAWFIRPDQVQGTVATSLPKLGYLVVFLKQRTGIAAVMTGFLALVLLWGLFFPSELTVATPRRTDGAVTPVSSPALAAFGRLRRLDDAAFRLAASALSALRSKRVAPSL